MTEQTKSFLQLKNVVNTDLHNSFSSTFKSILRKFDSLSRSNNYRKIKRVNIINISTKTNTCILNLLNKLSNTNQEVILQKITQKISDNNILILFIDQILDYVGKSRSNLDALYFILKEISRQADENNFVKIDRRINEFIVNFSNSLDIYRESKDKEAYLDFVERNHSNESVISRMQFIYTIINDQTSLFKLQTDINVLFNILIFNLNKIIESNPENENSIFLILECIMIIIDDLSLKSNVFAYKKFNNMFNNDEVKKKLKFKIRFKLLDILDKINNHGS